jgi:hypothetical protein
MSEESSDDYINSLPEVKEPDQYSFQKQEGFSHQLSVQKAYYKVIDNLDVEMVEGFWQEMKDKHGNVKLVHQKDTRQEAIESIKTLKNVMIADIENTPYSKEINKLLDKIDDTELECIKEQKRWWNSLDYQSQEKYQSMHLSFDTEHLYDKLCYWHDFLNQQVNIYREIFEQLELCLAKIRYFKKSKKTNIEGMPEIFD